MKLRPGQWYQIARIVSAALRTAGVEWREARGADSAGGRKVTRHEAQDLAGAVLAACVEPLADILAESDAE